MQATFSIEKKTLPLKYPWAISRGSSTEKENFFVKMTVGKLTGTGEVAPNTRYNETPDKILSEFKNFQSIYNGEDFSFEEFAAFLSTMELSNSLRFGIESAFIHCHLKIDRKPVYAHFGLDKPVGVKTSFSIPIMDESKIEKFVSSLARYKTLKIKVDSKNALDVVNQITSLTDQALRIDANEAFTNYDELMNFLSQIKDKNIELIEQPFPSSMLDEYKRLKKESPFDIFADESIIENVNFSLLKEQFHGVNVKLMKAGGYVNAIRLLKQAKENSMKTMLGCMIESTHGIYCAMEISSLAQYHDLDGFLHLSSDPFNCVEEKFGQLYQLRANFR